VQQHHEGEHQLSQDEVESDGGGSDSSQRVFQGSTLRGTNTSCIAGGRAKKTRGAINRESKAAAAVLNAFKKSTKTAMTGRAASRRSYLLFADTGGGQENSVTLTACGRLGQALSDCDKTILKGFLSTITEELQDKKIASRAALSYLRSTPQAYWKSKHLVAPNRECVSWVLDSLAAENVISVDDAQRMYGR
jgi:hypothetical protein